MPMDHGGSRVQNLSSAYWGVLAGMEELIGTRDPSDFAKVMLAHLQNCINRKGAAYEIVSCPAPSTQKAKRGLGMRLLIKFVSKKQYVSIFLCRIHSTQT